VDVLAARSTRGARGRQGAGGAGDPDRAARLDLALAEIKRSLQEMLKFLQKD
jgi:hypothetical protein